MAIAAALTATPKAPRATSPRGDEPVPAVPPSPVAGAPTGITVGPFAVGVVGPPGVEEPGVVTVVTGIVVVVPEPVVVVVEVVVVVVGVTASAAQVGTLIVLSSSVTAPVCACTRPFTFAPVFNVAEVCARIEPTNVVAVPSVAELPTCQKTLQACAPPSRITELLDAVVKVEPA